MVAALQQIVQRATNRTLPKEAAKLGLGPAAVAELKSSLVALIEAEKTQEKKRASAPLSTKERNLTGNRILHTAALIAGAGMLAFANDPTTYASFEALLAVSMKPSEKKVPKKASEKAAAKPAEEPVEKPTEKGAEPEPPKTPESPVAEAESGVAEQPAA